MDANELRALADALDDCDPPYYESSPQINRSLDACIAKAADYLRAQADAQPVAWIAHNLTTGHVKWTTDRCRAHGWIQGGNLRVKSLYTHPAPAVPAGWKLVPVEPTPEMLDEGCDVDARAEVIKKYAAMPVIRNPENCCSCGEVLAVQYRAMLAAAPAAPQAEQPIDLDAVAMQQMRQAAAESTWMPSEYSGSDWISDVCRWLRDGPPAAAPQAEPIADSDADYWLRNRQAILDAIERAGFVLMSNASGFWLHPRGTTDAQAEQKREPLSDEQIDAALQTDPAMILALMNGRMTVGEFKLALRRLARAVERAAYERAAQECEKLIKRTPEDRWDHGYDLIGKALADAIRALGRQQ